MGNTFVAQRGFLVVLVASLVIGAFPSPGLAAEPSFEPVKRYSVTRKMVFPVVGLSKFWSGFGECRDNCTREHHGVDILTYGWKGLPVVAAHAGTISRVTYNEGNAGCSVRIRGRDRWETRYLHMNNDAPGTDDGTFTCVAPGIEVGATVEAGQIIGWVGDSGNSEDTVPHIHFELRNRSGYPIDPYSSLRKARRITFEWLPSDPSETSILVSQANNLDTSSLVFVVSSKEAGLLTRTDRTAVEFRVPLIVVDEQNPEAGLSEIERFAPGRIVIYSDSNVSWLSERLVAGTRIVDVASLPAVVSVQTFQQPDGLTRNLEPPATPDRFTTVVSGALRLVWRGYREAVDTFIADHRTLVLMTDRRAARGLRLSSRAYPGKSADREKLWWETGDGWVGTATVEEAPPQGFAYVTERLATPWTLAFLASLAETPPMPLWRE